MLSLTRKSLRFTHIFNPPVSKFLSSGRLHIDAWYLLVFRMNFLHVFVLVPKIMSCLLVFSKLRRRTIIIGFRRVGTFTLQKFLVYFQWIFIISSSMRSSSSSSSNTLFRHPSVSTPWVKKLNWFSSLEFFLKIRTYCCIWVSCRTHPTPSPVGSKGYTPRIIFSVHILASTCLNLA